MWSAILALGGVVLRFFLGRWLKQPDIQVVEKENEELKQDNKVLVEQRDNTVNTVDDALKWMHGHQGDSNKS